MSINFSANQYENAFKTLKNWEIKKGIGKYPIPRDGLTGIVANDRGHLNSGVNRSRRSPWGVFVGTWDMPTKLPGHSIKNVTARSGHAVDRLDRMRTEGDTVLRGHLKPCKIPFPLSVKADLEASTGFVNPAISARNSPPSADSGRRFGANNPAFVDPAPISARNSPPSADSGRRFGDKFPQLVSPKNVEWPQPGATRFGNPTSPIPPIPRNDQNNMVDSPVSWHMPQVA